MITLDIYNVLDNTKIEKTYTAEGFKLMLGTVEDFMSIIDIDKLGDNIELAKMVVKGYGQIKPLLMDIFPELTADEYRRVSIDGLVSTIGQIGRSIVEGLDILKQGN